MVVHRPKPTLPDNEPSLKLLEHYLGIDAKTSYIIIGLVAIGLVVATGIYIGTFGFQHWRTNMNRAGDMMVINFDLPMAAQPMAPTGNPLTQRPVPAAAQSQSPFFCPSCGMLGLPFWSGGAPMCPTCGALMSSPGP